MPESRVVQPREATNAAAILDPEVPSFDVLDSSETATSADMAADAPQELLEGVDSMVPLGELSATCLGGRGPRAVDELGSVFKWYRARRLGVARGA